jgi:hypothetical protein
VPSFLSSRPNSRLIPLPWELPLADWPADRLVALPRGISRHVVRFIRVDDTVYAAKEAPERVAFSEYRLLTELHRAGTPAVEPLAVVTGRVSDTDEPLDPVLITRHLEFSLPYRSLFAQGVRPDTVSRLLDALVLLLARLHLAGFLWGDVSLSNVLFRRDAEEFAAYLVDAETGEMHHQLSTGQRDHDLEIAKVNLFGDFSDLESGGLLAASLDPQALVDSILVRYQELWAELTGAEEFADTESYRIEERVRRLNELGFDVAELAIETSEDGTRIRIQPKVVDAGHHSRRLLYLTGLDVEEYQARRLLNDLDTFRARTNQRQVPEAVVAHQWLTQSFQPVVDAVPAHLGDKREGAQLYHEVLDYRWYASQHEHREVPLLEAAAGYIRDVLTRLPDEAITPAADTRQLANPYDPSQGFNDDDDDGPIPVDPWETEEGVEDSGVLDIEALRARIRQAGA